MATVSNSARQFLVDCLRAYLAREAAPLSTSLDETDGEALLELAAFHRVAPLLHKSLREAAPQNMPPNLEAYVRSASSRGLLLTSELLRLLKRWEAAGVQAIPFKGPALAASLYGDPALRHFDDLDVLVRPQDFTAAKQVVFALGYQPKERHKFHESFVLARGNSEIVVELHWNIMDEDFPMRLDIDGIWKRRAAFALGGAKTTTLAPEDLLLFLCVHGSRHLWLRLQWLCDVAQLLKRNPALDWAQVMERAKIARGQRMLYLGIFLANDLLGAPLPPGIEQTVHHDLHTAELARQVKWRLFEGPLQLFKPWKSMNFKVQLIDRARDRFGYSPRYWLKSLTTPTRDDRSSVSLPKPLSPLYYLIRPVRLAIKYGRRVASGFYNQRKGT